MATNNAVPLDASQPTDTDRITIVDLLEVSGERTFGVLLVLLALPSALPIPAPGYSTPFGVVIVLLALQMVIGFHHPWLPKVVRNSSLKRQQAQGLLATGLPWLQRLEQISRPRFSFVSNSVLGRSIIGLMIVLMGLFMMIPVPGTNTIPAMIIFILGFSLIEEDGLISLFGVTAGLVGSGVVAIALKKGLPLLLNTIQSL
ncbi:MAG: exopolysaccharide biosynthesis protein [Merismopedia sp. SIO2A8]|nr:exopolysaccharide biosynthesis protein [Symploca sp. SIO2B6]NET49878.1 exopolysaccharide biosynthesis protein [Merismopedia sp. SIO2A8]